MILGFSGKSVTGLYIVGSILYNERLVEGISPFFESNFNLTTEYLEFCAE